MIDINPLCSECGKLMSDSETEYYGFRCEGCERDWHDRVSAWRLGGDDEELDTLYGELRLARTH